MMDKKTENVLNFLDKMEGKTDAEQEEVLDALMDNVMEAIESGELALPSNELMDESQQRH